MNILDENILNDQKRLLKMWKIPVHQIGDDMGWKGMQDEGVHSQNSRNQIIPKVTILIQSEISASYNSQ